MLTPEQLHGYQRYAADFIVENSASAILLDCGCGKTIITLTPLSASPDGLRSGVSSSSPHPRSSGLGGGIGNSPLRGLRYSIAVGKAKGAYALGVDADIYIVNRDGPLAGGEYAGNWRWDMRLDELSTSRIPKLKVPLLKVRPRYDALSA